MNSGPTPNRSISSIISGSSFESFLLWCIRFHAVPVGLFYKGGWRYIFYVLLLSGVSVGMTVFLDIFLGNYLELLRTEQPISPEVFRRLELTVYGMIRFFSGTLLFVVLILPVRSFFLFNGTPLWNLLRETPPAYARALQTIVRAARVTFFYMIPVFGVLLSYQIITTEFQTRAGERALYFLGIVVFAFSGSKALPILVSPIIAVLGYYQPWRSVEVAPLICRRVRLWIIIELFIFLLSSLLYLTVRSWVSYLFLFPIWYGATMLATTLGIQLVQFEDSQSAEQR